jgi:hypothetical protein
MTESPARCHRPVRQGFACWPNETMARNLRKRLDRLERTLIDFANEKQDDFCNCREMIVADPAHPDQFEAEMNRFCPVHGLRDLGSLIHVHHIVPADPAKSAVLDRLVQEYESRRPPDAIIRDRLRQLGLELKNEAERS